MRHVILRHVVRAAVCSVALLFALVLVASIAPADAETGAKPIKIVALGDSLTAGLGLPESEGFVARLQAALAAKGLAATVINAGVSGDTASDALARLDWSVPDDTDAVVLEIGANDMLRGIKPTVTRIRRSFRPKRVALVSAELYQFVGDLSAQELACDVVLSEAKPFALSPNSEQSEISKLREALATGLGVR